MINSRAAFAGVWSHVARPSSRGNLSPRSSVTSSHNRISRWKSGEADVQTTRVIGNAVCGSRSDQAQERGSLWVVGRRGIQLDLAGYGRSFQQKWNLPFLADETDVALIGRRVSEQVEIEFNLLRAALSQWDELAEFPLRDVDLCSGKSEGRERFGRFVFRIGSER